MGNNQLIEWFVILYLYALLVKDRRDILKMAREVNYLERNQTKAQSASSSNISSESTGRPQVVKDEDN